MDGLDIIPNFLKEELNKSDVVRLRGLPFSAIEADVAAFFRGLELGPDRIVICINFRGITTGHAFVQFASPDVANKALEWDRQQIGRFYVEVSKGHAADMQGALRMVGRGSATRMTDRNVINTGIPGMAGHSDMRYPGVIRVRGMPYSCTSTDIVAFFKGMHIVPDGIFHCTHPDNRPAGEAFVEFINEETALRAMRMNHELFAKRRVELCPSTKGEMMTAIQKKMFSLFSSAGDLSHSAGQGQESMDALGPQGLAGMNLAAIQAAGLGITGLHNMGDISQSVCIKMKNLPYSAPPQEIMRFFEKFRIVPNGIHMVTGLSGRSTGEAFVEFVSADETRKAMDLNMANMGTRYVELLRATKCELLIAMGELPGFNSAEMVDPSLQLLLLQRQAATGAFGTSEAAKEKAGGALPESQTTAARDGANTNLLPPGFSGPSSTNQHRPPSKMQGAQYRSAA